MTQKTVKPLDEIKENLKTKNLILGTGRCFKLLKQDKINKIFLSSNTPKEIEDDFNYYGNLSGIEIIKLKLPNDELGTFCKKTYSVSVIGLLK